MSPTAAEVTCATGQPHGGEHRAPEQIAPDVTVLIKTTVFDTALIPLLAAGLSACTYSIS